MEAKQKFRHKTESSLYIRLLPTGRESPGSAWVIDFLPFIFQPSSISKVDCGKLKIRSVSPS